MLEAGRYADDPALAAWIRALRTELGWSQRELAEHLGVERVTVTNWEAGVAAPRALTMRELRVLACEEES